MTPDMKRLCEAAAREGKNLDVDYEGGYAASEDPADWEGIVRAVLVALREPGDEPLAAAAVDMLADVTDPWDCMPRQMDEAFGLDPDGPNVWGPAEEQIRPNMKRAFAAMLNAILAEPAKA